jgi:hypothetical protein
MGAGMASAQPGPLAGTTIADFMTRIVAWIIDSVILGVIGFVASQITFRILPFGIDLLAHAILIVAVSAGYFIYMWTVRRQTVGMIAMKLLVVTEGTGQTLTQSQAIQRWLYLGLPLAIASLLSVGLGFGFFGFGLGLLAILFVLAPIAGLIAIGWQIFLLVQTNNDPRKRGPHDKAANSIVVAYGPSPFGGAR